MIYFREYQKRSLIPIAALGLAAYYAMVFVPVKHRAESLDVPLRQAWRRLAASLDQTNSAAIDFLNVTNQLAETRQALAAFEAARQKAISRIDLPTPLRVKLNSQFELVDFQNERSKELDDLMREGKEAQVTIEAPVFTGYPEHTADMKRPALLWPALLFANSVARTAIDCKVESLHSLEMPIGLTNSPAGAGDQLVQIPIELEFSGSFANILRFLELLPLRSEEARGLGYTNAPAEKPVLLIDRLFVKKESPDKPDHARVFIRAVGYVLEDERTSQ
jgi:hypothetical protein